MMMTSFKLIASLLLLAAAGCAMADPAGPQKLDQLARANDDFGLQLLHRLELAEKYNRGTKHTEPQNLFISPFSVSTVLSMLMAGAGNETYEEIRKTLAFDQTLKEQEIYSNYRILFDGLKKLITESDKKNELQVANSIALQDKFKLLQTYLDTVTKNFDSKIFNVDFFRKAHQATEEINKWVCDKTNGKIDKLFKEDLDANTAMVLLNAIYFKGAWRYKFDKTKTVSAPFRFEYPNQNVIVPTMNMKAHFKYAHFDDGDLVELPYESDSLSMLVYLPDPRWVKEYQTIAGQFARIVEHGSIKLASRLAELRNVSVNLQLPKFKIENDFSLKTQLSDLGIVKAFSSATADFSRIDGERDLFLNDVVHKTFLEVNEEGSEAAAVTGAVVQLKSMPMIHEFNANRPFLFLIRDNLHQLTLFAGVVNKP